MAEAARRTGAVTPDELIAAGLEAFAAARQAGGGDDVDYTLATRRVRISVAGSGFSDVFSRALARRPVTDGETPTMILRAWDAESTGTRMRADWIGQLVGPIGVVEQLTDDRYHVSMEVHSAMLSVVDTQTGNALHYVPDAALLPYWERTHPARLLWAAWARAQGMLMCHAAGVGIDGRGALVVGPSGSGKSTTALACLNAGMQTAGDDYVLVEPRGADESPLVHALYTSSLIEVGHARRFPQLIRSIDGLVEQSPDRAKAVTYAVGDGRPQMSGGFAAVAIAVPRVRAGDRSSYVRIAPAAALRALAPSTLWQLGIADSTNLAALVALCRRLPCYELTLGTDLDAVPGLLAEMIVEAAKTPVGEPIPA